MKIFFVLIECISAILLVVTVLLHSAKGEGFGLLQPSHFFKGGRGLESELNRVTAIVAAVFLVSAVILGLFFK